MATIGHKTPTPDDDADPRSSDARRPRRGLLIVGHGTQEPAGTAEFQAVVGRIARRAGEVPVEAGFLEFAHPTIATGFDRLVARGAREIVAVPLVLFAAGHARRDIPRALTEAAAKHSDVAWRQTPHLGCAEPLVRLSVGRFREACPDAGGETLLVLAGRGSGDADADAEFRRFAALRAAADPACRLETAYVALSQPPLADVLDAAGRGDFRRIVVQPHLLFSGVLLERVRALTAATAARFGDRQWQVTSHLGVADELVEAALGSVS